jgi:hypothetical protein
LALRVRIDGAPLEQSQLRVTREAFTAALEDSSDTSDRLPIRSNLGKIPPDGINESIAETAVSAAAAVLSLRDAQRALVEESKERAYGDGTITRQTEAANLETEIARISTSATYNGVNAIGGQLLTLRDTGSDLSAVSALPSLSSVITTSARLSDQTPSNSSTDLEILKDSVNSATSLLLAYESAAAATKRAGEVTDNPFVTSSSFPVRGDSEAQDLARRIAASVTSPYATDRQKLTLIEMSTDKLDQEKVYKLIA